jgi:hypothetical protein
VIDTVAPIFRKIATNNVVSPAPRVDSRAALRSAYLGARPGIKNANSFFHHPRPSAVPRGVNHVGLGSARNFSSAQPVFQNIVHNAPLALRAFGNQVDGFDAKKLRREVRRSIKRQQQQKQAKLEFPFAKSSSGFSSDVRLSSLDLEGSSLSADDSDDFFASLPSPFMANVSLNVPLEPSLPAGFDDFSQDSSRLLPRSFLASLRDIQEHLDVHRIRLRSLLDRLERAGCFDDENVRFWDPSGGMLAIEFGGWWTATDVRQALGVWDGQKTWFDIIDHQSTPPREPLDLSCPTLHDIVADTFVLPSVAAIDSPPPPTSSPSPSTGIEMDYSLSDSESISDMSSWNKDMEYSSSSHLSSSFRSGSSYRSDVRAFLAQVEDLDGAAFTSESTTAVRRTRRPTAIRN